MLPKQRTCLPPLCKGRGTAVGGGGAVGNLGIFNQTWFVAFFMLYNAKAIMFDMA